MRSHHVLNTAPAQLVALYAAAVRNGLAMEAMHYLAAVIDAEAVNTRSPDGWRPLFYAVQSHDPRHVRALAAAGADETRARPSGCADLFSDVRSPMATRHGVYQHGTASFAHVARLFRADYDAGRMEYEYAELGRVADETTTTQPAPARGRQRL